jgi:fructose-bisphosphate aldolase class I
MEETIQKLLAPSKGILAADSINGIVKRFSNVGLTYTPELDLEYKTMLYATPGLERFISGTILNDNNIRQNIPFNAEIVKGIKVDQGLEPFGEKGEEVTRGLEGLENRLKEYLGMGAKFTKWRGVFSISDIFPTDTFINENLDRMVNYAKLCLANGLVPIVEPEVLLKGNHTTTRCELIETKVLQVLFEKLKSARVDLTSLILKTSMVMPGKESGVVAAPLEVANATLRTLKNSVPPEVPAVVFLSGGQTPDESTNNLNEIVKLKAEVPWDISFSYERALQNELMETWAGKSENVEQARKVFLIRLEKVSKARNGQL